MTSDEIRAAIHRVGNTMGRTTDEVIEALCDKPVNGCILRGKLIDLLKQADPDTHMKLPRDADCEVIHIGDEMEGADPLTTGERDTVHGFERNANGAYEWIGDHQVRHDCDLWRHYHRSTMEELLEKALNEAAMLDRQKGYWPSAADITNIVSSLTDKLQLRDVMQDE